MDCKALLLAIFLIAVAESQPTVSLAAILVPAEKIESADKASESTSATVDATSQKSSESTDKYIFAKKQELQNSESNYLTPSNEDASDLIILESLIEGIEKIFEKKGDAKADGEESTATDGDDTENKKYSSNTVLPNVISNSDRVQVRRQGELNPEFGQRENNQPGVQFDEPLEVPNNQNSQLPPLYPPGRQQRIRPDVVLDGSPVLQLTQGGYQRPYQNSNGLGDQRQRAGPVSASQQSETVKPASETAKADEQVKRPQAVPEVAYTSPFQPSQLGFGPGPVLRNSFMPGIGSYANSNGILASNFQNGFLNTPSNGFQDFAPLHLHPQYPASNDVGGFSPFARDPSTISLFQTPQRSAFSNPGLLFQSSPQFNDARPAMIDPQSSLQSQFQQGYPSFEADEDASRPDFTSYFRNPTPTSHQFQLAPNFYTTNPRAEGAVFNNPSISMLSNYPNAESGSPFSSRFPRYPIADSQRPPQNIQQQDEAQQRAADSSQDEQKLKESEPIKDSPNRNLSPVPFGTRIQAQEQNNSGKQDGSSGQNGVYIRYPMREAGYATEENLPLQNTTEESSKNNNPSQRPPITYFQEPGQFRVSGNGDPYKEALNAVLQGIPRERVVNKEGANSTNEYPGDQFLRNVPLPFGYSPVQTQTQSQVFPTYPDRSQDVSNFPNPSFYPGLGRNINPNPFDQLPSLPGNNYQFINPENGAVDSFQENSKTPTCAQKNNASMCFEDPEYPKRAIMYALNSDSYLMERFVLPDQRLDGIALVEQNKTGNPQNDENYICNSDVKYGTPLRAKNVKGSWKVIVNIEKDLVEGGFVQPVRLEVCRGAGDPCKNTRIKTACVQKFSLHRLLSWSPEKGVHNDVYKLPMACSCQIIDGQV